MNDFKLHASAFNSLLARVATTLIFLAISLGLSRTALAISPPFTQCPAVGADASCAILIVLNAGGSVSVLSDPSQGPFDGVEDTLIGVQNNTGITIPDLQISSATLPIFGFDGDGICAVATPPAGCPFGPTGYEGLNTTFTGISGDTKSGTVNFTGGLPPGGSAYFGLEDSVTTASLNIPPNCASATASFPALWPPNHRFVPETITGVISLLPVTISITSIFQDEPVLEKGFGSGHTCPDGTGVGGSIAQVRAERDGTGTGRVYHIGFTATDTSGKMCSGQVLVCVPHDQSGAGSSCVDEGPLFDSTKCP